MRLLLLILSLPFAFLSVQFSETAPQIEDISRLGGVALPELRTETGTADQTILQVGDARITLGRTDEERKANSEELRKQLEGLKTWFETDLDGQAGQYSGVGKYLYSRISERINAEVSEGQSHETSQLQKLAQWVLFAQSLKDRHIADGRILDATAPEHEFYFRLVSNPGNRLFALQEWNDGPPDPNQAAPVKLKVNTRSTGLRVRGIMNREETVANLAKGTVVEGQAVMLKGLLPVGYRVLLPGRNGNKINGFVAGAYVLVENGQAVSTDTGLEPRYQQLAGKDYLYLQLWKSVSHDALRRAGQLNSLFSSQAATAPSTAGARIETFMAGLDLWLNSSEFHSKISPLTTPAGGLELGLAPELQKLAEDEKYKDIFDPRQGILTDRIRALLEAESNDEARAALQQRVNDLVTEVEAAMKTESLQFYLRDAQTFRSLESQLPAVNAPIDAIATSGVDLRSVNRRTQPDLYALAQIVNNEELKAYFPNGRLDLTSLAKRFGDAGRRQGVIESLNPFSSAPAPEVPRTALLTRLNDVASRLRQLDVGKLTAQSFAAPGSERVVDPAAVEGQPSATGTTSVSSPAIVSADSQPRTSDVSQAAPIEAARATAPNYRDVTSFGTYAFSFVPKNIDQREFRMTTASPVFSLETHHLIFSTSYQKYMHDRIAPLGAFDGRGSEAAQRLADALFLKSVGSNATVFLQDNFEGSANSDGIIHFDNSAMQLMIRGMIGMRAELLSNLDLSRLGDKKDAFLNVQVRTMYAPVIASTQYAMYIIHSMGKGDDLRSGALAESLNRGLDTWKNILTMDLRTDIERYRVVHQVAGELLAAAGSIIEQALQQASE